MTMAMTIPSSQGQAREDLKPPPPSISPHRGPCLQAAGTLDHHIASSMLGLGGSGPAMSTHLATPPYAPYPGCSARYGDYHCWFSAGSADSAPAEEAPPPDALSLPAAKTPSPSVDSPASSSSGTLTQYHTPDSATSPTAAGSPSPLSALQKVKAQGKGVVKTKSRTAFSQDQLKALHQRFQSQKYLSPQQIRELAAALELTYKQVKTWFQNQRMKFKRCQKESQWVDKGMYLPQNGVHQAAYLDIAPTFHQVFPVGGGGRNFPAVPNVHQTYNSGQTYGDGQNLYSLVSVEDEGLFGKGGTSSNTQQTMGLLSQQMNFYHSYFDNVDYVGVEVEDSFNFQNTSDTVTPFSSSPIQNQCQLPWHPMGVQSWYESQV